MRLILTGLISATVFFSAPDAGALHIMLDPGHGGMDTGAVYSGAKEADLVLKVAAELKRLLEADTQFKVSLTRTTDKIVTLPERVKMAEDLKVDLFVSLHANAAIDRRAKGVEFFFQNHLPPDEESLYLASQENQMITQTKEIQHLSGGEEVSKKGDVAAIIEDLHRQSRMESSWHLTKTLTNVWQNDANAPQATIKQAPFYVITKTTMPSVLIEIGFLSNPHEVKKLLSQAYQKDLAQKIYTALLSYKEKIDNSTAKTLN